MLSVPPAVQSSRSDPDGRREKPGDGAEREAARPEIRADLRERKQLRQTFHHRGIHSSERRRLLLAMDEAV